MSVLAAVMFSMESTNNLSWRSKSLIVGHTQSLGNVVVNLSIEGVQGWFEVPRLLLAIGPTMFRQM